MFSGPQESSRTIFIVKGGFLYAATSSLKRFSGMIFRISGCFHRSKSNFRFGFLYNKAAKNNFLSISAHTESTDLIFGALKQIFIS
jgi:hypothetical protein